MTSVLDREYPYVEEERNVIFNLDNMMDTSFSEDEVVPPPVSKVPVFKCHKDSCLEFENNSDKILDVLHEDYNSSRSSFEMDVENEEVQPLVLCTEINTNVEFDE